MRRVPIAPPLTFALLLPAALLGPAALLSPAVLIAQETLVLGEWTEGVLEKTDPTDPDGFYYDAFTLPEGVEGLISVTVESEVFDTYLEWGVMGGGQFMIVAENDDFEGLTSPTDSRVYVRVGPGERPELRVFSLDAGPDGPYRVRIAAVASGDTEPSPIEYGADVAGTLGEGDAFEDGTFLDRFHFEGSAGEVVKVVLEADFDAYLTLGVPGSMPIAEDDDGFGGTDSYLEVELPADGSYEVTVTSFLSGSGDYRLRLGPDLDVEPSPDAEVTAALITDEEREGLQYDGERAWHDLLAFSLPSPGADFTLMDAAMAEELMGEGAPNVHMWIFQDVLETAQFMIMVIKTGAVADRATVEMMTTLLQESAAVEVLEEEDDWEGSRSFFSHFAATDGSEAELRCMASPEERTAGLIVCLLGSSTDGWSFRELMGGLEVR